MNAWGNKGILLYNSIAEILVNDKEIQKDT